jgi:hypothetical protein
MGIPESPETRVFLEKCRFFEISVLTESLGGLRGPLTAADHLV